MKRKAPDTPSIDLFMAMLRQCTALGIMTIHRRLMVPLHAELSQLRAERDEFRTDAELFRFWVTTGRGYSTSHTIDGIRADLAARKAKQSENPPIDWKSPEL